MGNRKVVLERIMPTCVLVGVLIFNLLLVTALSGYDVAKVNAHATDSYITIGELYQHPDNVQRLYDLLCRAENIRYQRIYETATKTRNAQTLRNYDYLKTKWQDIQVVFGGLTWQVCYLSLTGEEDDAERIPILTLMLADPDEISKFQTWYTVSDFDAAYPANLYGTSYLRAVALNNGGQYATGPHTLTTATPDAKSPWAIFTMDDVVGSVTDALVKPNQVAWQAHQSAIDVGVSERNYFNEAWGEPSNPTFYGETNYYDKDLQDAWKNDYLWLPSYSEVGNHDKDGIWRLRNTQRKCRKAYWLRSVAQRNDTFAAGLIKNDGDFEDHFMVNNGGYYVLPALHLNLAALSLRALKSPCS